MATAAMRQLRSESPPSGTTLDSVLRVAESPGLRRWFSLRLDFVESIATCVQDLLIAAKERFVRVQRRALLRPHCNIIDTILGEQVGRVRPAREDASNLRFAVSENKPMRPDVAGKPHQQPTAPHDHPVLIKSPRHTH